MPRLIAPGDGDALALDDFVAALDAQPVDPRDEDSLVAAGPLLARLGRNGDFLARLALDELKGRGAPQAGFNGYGAQVLMLKPPGARYTLRANFWPAARDAVTRASGEAAFFYHLPHDHDFAFLTYGYLGPGYWSDYWERDPAATVGVPGEVAGLVFTGRRRLEPGRLMLYRRHVDVHSQLPPDSFSVSLNILFADPEPARREQYRFDVAAGTFAQGLSVTASEVLLALSVHMGDGIDVAASFARAHASPRMRVAALDALRSAGVAGAWDLIARAAGDADRYVAAHARLRLADAAVSEAVGRR